MHQRHVAVVELAERLRVAFLGAAHQSHTSTVSGATGATASVLARGGGATRGEVRSGEESGTAADRPASGGEAMRGAPPPPRQPDLDRLPLPLAQTRRRRSCGSGPMVTTSPQPVHVKPAPSQRPRPAGPAADDPFRTLPRRRGTRDRGSHLPRRTGAEGRPRAPGGARRHHAGAAADLGGTRRRRGPRRRPAMRTRGWRRRPGGRPAAQRHRLAARRAGRPAGRPRRRPREHRLHRSRTRLRPRGLRGEPVRDRRAPRAGRRAFACASARRTPAGRPPRWPTTPPHCPSWPTPAGRRGGRGARCSPRPRCGPTRSSAWR